MGLRGGDGHRCGHMEREKKKKWVFVVVMAAGVATQREEKEKKNDLQCPEANVRKRVIGFGLERGCFVFHMQNLRDQ